MVLRMGGRSGGRIEGRGPRSSPLGLGPAAVALVLLVLVTERGLRPALAEEARLDRAEAELEERIVKAEALGAELDQLLRAQADPIYVERERRMLLRPEGPAATALQPSGLASVQD